MVHQCSARPRHSSQSVNSLKPALLPGSDRNWGEGQPGKGRMRSPAQYTPSWSTPYAGLLESAVWRQACGPVLGREQTRQSGTRTSRPGLH